MTAAKVLCALLLGGLLGITAWWIYGEVTEPDSGTVYGKHYSPAYFQMICSGNPVTCHSTYIPECYEIRYADGDKKGDACVSAREYDRYRAGDHFPAGAR